MDFHELARRRGAALDPAVVDPFLDCNMGLGLKLETAHFRLGAVVTLQRAFDIDDWVSIVSLDQVAVVTVHRPEERRKRCVYTLRQTAGETRRSRGQFNGEVSQPGSMP